MATTWKTIAVRVQRPPKMTLAEFFADMRSWLDHQCILPAEFRSVTLANKSDVFDVLFDNPRDALLFGRRFAAHSTGRIPVRSASRPPSSATGSAIDQNRNSILAGIAGDIRNVWWNRAKLYQRA